MSPWAIDNTRLGPRIATIGRVKKKYTRDSALWLKYVDPEEGEGERFKRYDECLRLAS